jgi:hypothetical protein
MDIALMGNTLLRLAIRENLVSFPSQVPLLMRCRDADALERMVQLYFLRGWSVRNICARYRLSKAMVQKLLSEWRMRAVAAGYIQDIHPAAIEALARAHAEHAKDAHAEDECAFDEIAAAFNFETAGLGKAVPVWAPAPAPHPDPSFSSAGGV